MEALHQYEKKSQGYGICRLVETLGNGVPNEAIETIVELHDEYACQDETTNLA